MEEKEKRKRLYLTPICLIVSLPTEHNLLAASPAARPSGSGTGRTPTVNPFYPSPNPSNPDTGDDEYSDENE